MTSISLLGASLLNQTSFMDRASAGSRSRPSVRVGVRSDLSAIDSRVAAFESLVRDLADPAAWAAARAKSSLASVATVATTGLASPGEYSIEVSALARRQITTSTTAYSNTTETVADGGSISFTVDGETTVSIDVSTSTSLADLRDRINAQNSGVVASIANDAIANKLVISSRETGLGHGFTINDALTNSVGTVLAFEAGQGSLSGNTQNARNAAFTVDGRVENSDSNKVTAAEGVTMTLVGLGRTTLALSADTAEIRKSLESFVSEFNALEKTLSELASAETAVESGIRVAAGSALRTMTTGVRRALSDRREQSPGSLGDLGIGTRGSGGLKLDVDKLDADLATSASDVETLLRGRAGRGGIFSVLQDHLARHVGSSGLVTSSDRARSGRLPNISVAPLDTARQDKIHAINGIDRSIAALEKSYLLLAGLPKAS